MKTICPACKSSWTIAAGAAAPKACPFCGAALTQEPPNDAPETLEQCLALIVREFGADCLLDQRKTFGLVSDFAPSLYSERTLLKRFYDVNGSETYFDALNKTPESQRAAYELVVNRLTAEQFLAEEAARTICSVFWTVIGGAKAATGTEKKQPDASEREPAPKGISDAPKRESASAKPEAPGRESAPPPKTETPKCESAPNKNESAPQSSAVPKAAPEAKSSPKPAETKSSAANNETSEIWVFLFHAAALGGLYLFPKLWGENFNGTIYEWFLIAVVVIDLVVFAVKQETVSAIGAFLFGVAGAYVTFLVIAGAFEYFGVKSFAVQIIPIVVGAIGLGIKFGRSAAACSRSRPRSFSDRRPRG